MIYLGTTDMENLHFLCSPDDLYNISSYFFEKQTTTEENVLFFKTYIQHSLRSLSNKSIHNETWVFCIIRTKDSSIYLCPLKRDSDFEYDIFQKIEDVCKINDNINHHLWKRHSL
jgi:hypothetical protein